MTRMWSVLVSLFSICLSSFSQQSEPASKATQQGYRIDGVVVREATRQPLNHTLVEVSGVGRQGSRAMFLTSADGRFAFELPAGKYQLAASREGYPHQFYLDDEQYSTAVVVGPHIQNGLLVFPLKAPGVLSGSVSDDHGDPVPSGQVHLFRKSVSEGQLRIQPAGQAQTDTAGVFSFDQLQPGTYLVAVSARPWYAEYPGQISPDAPVPASPDGGVRRDVAYPLTYYPDATDPEGATLVEVREGTPAKIRFVLHPVPALKVKLPRETANVQVSAIGPDGLPIPSQSGFGETDGELTVTGFAPGRYLFSEFSSREPGGQVNQMEHSASKVVQLNSDTTMDPGVFEKAGISGTFSVEGGGKVSYQSIGLRLQNEQGVNVAQTGIKADGTFRFDDNMFVIPGRYSVYLGSDTGELYLKSIMAAGVLCQDGIIDYQEGEVHLNIVAARGAQSLDGIALQDGKPYPGATVLLLPKDGSRSWQIRRDQSDGDGTFSLPNVAPGEYIVLAIDHGHQLAYRDPAVIKPYLPQGQRVEVPSERPLQVNVVPRQRS